MNTEFGRALREARKAKGMTLVQVAQALGVTYPAVQQWEAGKTAPSTENLRALAGLLQFDPFTGGRTGTPAAEGLVPNVDLTRAEDAPPLHRFGGPRDVEVRGTAVGGGGTDGDFRFNGQVIDRVPRPQGIANRRDVYALYVENDSMYPRFDPGARLYVDPHRRPRPGDDVVVELHSESESEPGPGFIKKLVKTTPTKLIVEQFNPPKQLEFEISRVKSLHRVIPMEELVGV
jgi:phage repressor protein C with HTH and peptisase S24 domain